MKRIIAAIVLSGASALVLSASQPADAQGAGALVIEGGTLVDGNGGPPMPNAVIVVEGNRIAAVGRAGQVAVPAGAKVIDAKSKWITPGLVDAKANWNWMYGEGFLNWGVTSAMVSGTRNDDGIADRDAINHGVYAGPRLFQSVINAIGTGIDGKRPDNFQPGNVTKIIHNAQEARQLVRELVAGGADFISTEDGMGPPAVFAAYADEAHREGKGMVMRCVGPQTRGSNCIMAEADVMIHTGQIGNEINRHPEVWANYTGLPPDNYCDMDPAKEKAMITLLIEHHTAVEPDFVAADRGFPSHWARVQQEDHAFFDDPNLRAYYPEFAIQDLWNNIKSPKDFLSPAQYSLRECGFKNHTKFIHDLIAAGGRAVVASDITQSAPGLGLHQEMAIWQEDAHIPPMKILQAATSWVAQQFRIPDIGSVEKGKFADILIVNADPTKDIMNLRKIDTVIKGGKIRQRGYDPGYRGSLFASTLNSYERGAVLGKGWERALARATALKAPPIIATVTAPNGGEVKIEAGNADPRRPSHPYWPDPSPSPTPGIATISVHTLIQGTGDTTVRLTGVNFTKRSRVYANGVVLPTEVTGPTALSFVVSKFLLQTAGKLHIVVKNPYPLATPAWGDTSNQANILVPFSFTTKWSHNRY